jgi:hypothetical protein
VPDESPSHALLVSALALLMGRWKGTQAAATHLGQIVALAMQTLNPGRPALRHVCVRKSASLLQQLASHFPHLALHAESLQLVFGSPWPITKRGTRQGASGGGAAAAAAAAAGNRGAGGEAGHANVTGKGRRVSHGAEAGRANWMPLQQVLVVVYDLQTGQQKRLLSVPSNATSPYSSAASTPPLSRQGSLAGSTAANGLYRTTSKAAAAAAEAVEAGAAGGGSSAAATAADGAAGGAAGAAGTGVQDGAGDALVPPAPVPPSLSGVACVAFSPSGEQVAALLPAAHCVAVWKLSAGWGEVLGLSRGGSSVPPAALLWLPDVALMGCKGVSSEEGSSGALEMGFRLQWQSERRVDVLRSRQCVASLELA